MGINFYCSVPLAATNTVGC